MIPSYINIFLYIPFCSGGVNGNYHRITRQEKCLKIAGSFSFHLEKRLLTIASGNYQTFTGHE
jgi:hypothetical protein